LKGNDCVDGSITTALLPLRLIKQHRTPLQQVDKTVLPERDKYNQRVQQAVGYVA